MAASRVGFEFAPVTYTYHPLQATAAQQNPIGVRRWDVQPADASFGAGFLSNSIALDTQGRPHISYYVSDINDLRHAWWTGHQWQIRTVDASVGITRAGEFNSVALDSLNRPHISYLFWDGVSPGRRLRHAQWTDFQGWVIEEVDTSDSLNFPTTIVLDAADRPHISYYDTVANVLKYARKDGPGWHIETVDASGRYNSLGLDSQGRPHICYSDDPWDSNGVDALKYAFWDGTAWQTSIVDASNGFWAGAYCVLALDSSDRAHIAYSALHPANVKYAWWNGASWTRETVRSGSDFVLGTGNSLSLRAGVPHILYHSPYEGLFHAQRTAPGWSSTLVHPGYAGLFSDMTSRNVSGAPSPLHAAYWDGHLVQMVHARSEEIVDPPWSPPAIAITSPANGAVVSGAVMVRADPQSPVGIRRVELLVDGVAYSVDATTPYAFEWDSTGVSNVVHTLTARAIDATGAQAVHTISVQVVNVKPERGDDGR
jgi:hypothetical protein